MVKKRQKTGKNDGFNRKKAKFIETLKNKCYTSNKTRLQDRDLDKEWRSIVDVLLAGNTEYITEAFLEQVFSGCQVIIAGETAFNTNQRKNRIVLKGTGKMERLEKALRFYSFERIVYFSHFLTRWENRGGEMEILELLLNHCRENSDARLIYVTAEECGRGRMDLLAGSASCFCVDYAEVEAVSVKLIRVPALYSEAWLGEALFQMFEAACEKRVWHIDAVPENKLCFLSFEDLGELIYRVFDSWQAGIEVYEVPHDLEISLEELVGAMKQLEPMIEYSYLEPEEKQTEEVWRRELPPTASLREEYGWFPRYGIIEELPELYHRFCLRRSRKIPFYQKTVQYFRSQPWLLKTAELIAAALASEFLCRYTQSQAQFSMLDVRLLFVVLISTMYDMKFGMAAAFLASVSYGAERIREGTNALTLFYEPGNWIPFLAYLATAAVCSYVQMTSRDRIRFEKEENKLLRDKLSFIQELYLSAVRDKKKLRRQILGSRDSFGKIYNVIRQLDSARPQKIFLRSIHVLEELLENHSIAIYSLGRNKDFARLEAASKDIRHELSASVSMKKHQDAVEAAERGELWVNRALEEGCPMYMTGIRDNGELVLLLTVYKAEDSQMNLYFQNLMKILSGLIETSLVRALRYQNAVWEEEHVGGSIFLKEEYFYKKLEMFHRMYEDQVNSYTLMCLDRGSMSLEEASSRLMRQTRENDVLGLDTDQKIYMILNQTSPKQAGPAISRLEAAGFSCRIIDKTKNPAWKEEFRWK